MFTIILFQLQDYGQPPAELVGEVDTPFSFDPSGNPMAISNPDPSANPECSVMWFTYVHININHFIRLRMGRENKIRSVIVSRWFYYL